MKPEPKRNLPASVRQRLLTLSERRKEPFDLVLVRYGIERLLYRLSRSTQNQNLPRQLPRTERTQLDGHYRLEGTQTTDRG
jgi:hypothetical protein